MSRKFVLIALVFLGIGVGLGLVIQKVGVKGNSAQIGATQGDQQAGKQLWTCGMHPEVILDHPGNCPICGMKLVPVKGDAGAAEAASDPQQQQKAKPKGKRKILYWRAPMDPTEIYDHPGKSKMGMDLIPVYEDEAQIGKGGTIRIDPVTVQNMGVRTVEVRRVNFVRTVRTVGYVAYNEEKLYTISPKISGWIEKLYVAATGDEVRPNEPLLEIYSPELVTTQQEYLLALKTERMLADASDASIHRSARSLLESTRKRLLYWDIPRDEIARLERTGKVRKTLTLRSPARGAVIHKNAVEGAFVKAGQNLYQIADLSTVWVQGSIYDYELPWVHVGQKAEVELDYVPGRTFTGKVTYIYPYLDPKARDVKVRVELPNPDLELRPGMYATVRLKTEPVPGVLAVPDEAVIRTGTRNIVFVARGKGRFEPREIRIGEEGDGGLVRVLSGLLPGEKVVVSAQFMLDSESRLQEAIRKMIEEKTARKTSGKSPQSMEKPMKMKP